MLQHIEYFTPEFYEKWRWNNWLQSSTAVVYDIETFPNTFTINAEMLTSNVNSTWEISHYRDDRQQLLAWLNYLYANQCPMIGFNNLHFDYPVLHFLYKNPMASVEQIYAKGQQIITSNDRFGNTIWESDRFAPQIDLFKINHFDNKAKSTSLKALQINMRSDNVMETPIPFGTMLTPDGVLQVIKYNKHDVRETKKYAYYCQKAIEFRLGLKQKLSGDVMNFNDTKIGAQILEQRLGDELCYDRSSGRKKPRQTMRSRIALNDIIFPYIYFRNPEFQRVLEYMRTQVLTPEDLDDPDAEVSTKGVFKGLIAHVHGIEFHYGTGGIHGSVNGQRFQAGFGRIIRDIDVKGLYPSIAIVNRLAPEHLGEPFIIEYAKIPEERAVYQEKLGKKSVEANSMKLAGNGVYGKSKDKFSVFYDPKMTMTITINGQLLLSMLIDWLTDVPTLQFIQANTDGVTYSINEEYEPMAAQICKQWEQYTCLVLEDANYSRIWIRDVNNYIAEDTKGKLKQKGAYWHPESGDRYADSISESQPPAWHKDLGNLVSIKAAVAAMVHGVPVETFIRAHTDPFDFMCRVKVDRQSQLILGNAEIQKTTRYYVANHGYQMRKVSPPPEGCMTGDFKKKSKLPDAEYNAVMNELRASGRAGEWDERIHTKNKSVYEYRETSIQAGWVVMECNDATNFSFENLNYQFYIQEAEKLLIG